MAATHDAIPRVSIASINAQRADSDITVQSLTAVGKKLVSAYTDVGFCFIKDHGVEMSLIRDVFDITKRFFDLPLDVKKQRLRKDAIADYLGWLPVPNTPGIEVTPELFDATKLPDFKEIYNLKKGCDEAKYPTDEEVPGFRETTLRYIDVLELLTRRILLALGHGLDLEDPTSLLQSEAKLGTEENDSVLRYAFYPPVPDEKRSDNLLRCSEHSDFGHLTFLIENGVSGLEVMTRQGNYVKVPHCGDTILLNVCDSIERMSGGLLHSAPHRVVITEESAAKERYSIVYFNAPDRDAYLNPVCGEKERYREKITTSEFYVIRMTDIFERGKGIIKNATD